MVEVFSSQVVLSDTVYLNDMRINGVFFVGKASLIQSTAELTGEGVQYWCRGAIAGVQGCKAAGESSLSVPVQYRVRCFTLQGFNRLQGCPNQQGAVNCVGCRL